MEKNMLDQYTSDAIRTESRIDEVKANSVFLYSVMSMFQASGNMLDQIKKNTFYGKDFDIEQLKKDFSHIVDGLDGVTQSIHDLDQVVSFDIDPRLFHAIIGMATESAELVEALDFSEEGPDTVNILEELGDVMWYTGILVDTTGGEWLNILDTNIAKLKKRYPEKFTSDDAINRDTDSERDLLEDNLDHGC